MAEGSSRAAFDRHTRIVDVLALGEGGRADLYEHGFDAGQGFVDALSQYQTLEDAHRAGRLRDLEGLLARLNGR